MRLLLTSAGITNESIANSLEKLVGKSRRDIKIGFVPTASNTEPGNKDWFLKQLMGLVHNNFNYVDIIDFSAQDVDWKTRLNGCDVIFLSGGNTFHLLNQIRKFKFGEWLKTQLNTKVYVGASASSILVTPSIGIASIEPADENIPNLKDITGLNLVEFEISPHTPNLISYEGNEVYAKTTQNPIYLIDDQSAVEVFGEGIKVVSEGKWKLINTSL